MSGRRDETSAGWHVECKRRCMQAKSIEDLVVWRDAWRLVAAVSAITRVGTLAKDLKLRSQIDDCADSILSNLSEGFEQGSDRGFARYVYIARGSCAEARTHLSVAVARGHIAADEAEALRKDGAEILGMLTGFINYLLRSDRKRRR
jgi:four helix bundle protein